MDDETLHDTLENTITTNPHLSREAAVEETVRRLGGNTLGGEKRSITTRVTAMLNASFPEFQASPPPA
jgi:hypothetical protein